MRGPRSLRHYPNGRDFKKIGAAPSPTVKPAADDAAPLPPASGYAPCVDFLQHRAGQFRS
jgi:hypothetical protein